MKKYEKELDYILDYSKNTIIRLDGKTFSKMKSKWNLNKPYDDIFYNAMLEASKYLLQNIQDAKLVWTGSDEISIFIDNKNMLSPWYSKRLCKWLSISASYTSVIFNNYILSYLKDNNINDNYFNVLKYPAFFDSKVFQFPNEEEALNNLIYRQNDFKRNSISEFANTYYSHKKLLNKNSTEKLELLKDINFDYSKIDNWKKYGTLLYKENIIYDINTKEPLNTIEEFNDLKHYIRTNIKTISEKLSITNMKDYINEH